MTKQANRREMTVNMRGIKNDVITHDLTPREGTVRTMYILTALGANIRFVEADLIWRPVDWYGKVACIGDRARRGWKPGSRSEAVT